MKSSSSALRPRRIHRRPYTARTELKPLVLGGAIPLRSEADAPRQSGPAGQPFSQQLQAPPADKYACRMGS